MMLPRITFRNSEGIAYFTIPSPKNGEYTKADLDRALEETIEQHNEGLIDSSTLLGHIERLRKLGLKGIVIKDGLIKGEINIARNAVDFTSDNLGRSLLRDITLAQVDSGNKDEIDLYTENGARIGGYTPGDQNQMRIMADVVVELYRQSQSGDIDYLKKRRALEYLVQLKGNGLDLNEKERELIKIERPTS